MKKFFDYLPLGSSYYPPFHAPADWERDIRRMAECGLNTIRSGELIASWEWIEPRRNQFDFSWLDRLFELASKYGLRILLGTGAASPPIWMLDAYPDLPIVSRDGDRYPTGTMWQWACLDHPGLRIESERYLRTLLARYKDHPGLLAWQIHNEIGFPILPRKSSSLPVYCYCSHTANKFRDWLQTQYANVEELSEAWACTPTRHRYAEWHQVQPPRSLPAEWGPVKAWLDWRNFIYDDFAEFVAWQNVILHSADPNHPTTANLIDTLTNDCAVLHGADPWRIVTKVDAIGWDMYPSGRAGSGPTFCSMFLDNAYSTAAHSNVPLWIPEMESGPIGGWSLGPNHTTTGLDIKRYNLEALAHGAKMILYQGYREWNALPLHWGALVDLNGEPTERYDAARQINQMVSAHQAFFQDALPAPAEVGILYSQDNVTTAYGMNALDHFRLALGGVYQTLWQLKVPVEFITPELLIAGKGHHYRALFAPFLMNVSTELANALRAHVTRGGLLVTFAKFAMLDERGWYWNDRPGAGLTDLLGVVEKWIRVTEDVTLIPVSPGGLFDGVATPLKGYWHQQDLIIVAPTAQVVARFADGAPAVVSNHCGAGTAVHFGTHLDAAARKYAGKDYRRLLANLLAANTIHAPISLESADPDYAAKFIDVHRLKRGTETAVVVLNHGRETTAVRVICSGEPAFQQAQDWLSQDEIELQCKDTRIAFDLRLNGFDGTVIWLAR